MNQKSIYNFFFLFFFICFFFFWDINLYVFENLNIAQIGQIRYLELSLNFAIMVLLIPLIYSLLNKKKKI